MLCYFPDGEAVWLQQEASEMPQVVLTGFCEGCSIYTDSHGTGWLQVNLQWANILFQS